MVHPVEQLEPGALSDTTLLPPMKDHVVNDLRIQMSIAISLKRIADILEGNNPHMLGNLMENAGQAFALGMKGR